MILAALALAAGSALAQGGPVFCPGYVVEMTFAGVQGSKASVTVRDGSDQVFEVRLTDDGRGVDPVAADGTWCAPLPPICDGPLSLAVELGGQRHTLTLPLIDETGDQPRIQASLGPGGLQGRVVRGDSGEAPPPPHSPEQAQPGTPPPAPPPPGEPPPEPPFDEGAEDLWLPVPADGDEPPPDELGDPLITAGRRMVLPAELRGWAWAWGGVLALALVGGAFGWARARRRREARAAVAWRALPLRGERPVTVARHHLAAAMDGPLAGRSLVLVGQDPGGLPAGVLRLEAGALPAEVLAALVRAEGGGGGQAALLLASPEAPGAWCVDPLEELEEVVAGRFTVWVVDGPARWHRWSPEASA